MTAVRSSQIAAAAERYAREHADRLEREFERALSEAVSAVRKVMLREIDALHVELATEHGRRLLAEQSAAEWKALATGDATEAA